MELEKKKEGKTDAREREGPKERTELSEPVHCLHSLLTKFLQLQRAPAPHLSSMTFQRFRSLRVSTMHNSLSASDVIIKMAVFPRTPIATFSLYRAKDNTPLR